MKFVKHIDKPKNIIFKSVEGDENGFNYIYLNEVKGVWVVIDSMTEKVKRFDTKENALNYVTDIVKG